MTTKPLEESNIYEQLARYFEDENRGWWTGDMLDTSGRACLFGGVLAVGGPADLQPDVTVITSKKHESVRGERCFPEGNDVCARRHPAGPSPANGRSRTPPKRTLSRTTRRRGGKNAPPPLPVVFPRGATDRKVQFRRSQLSMVAGASG